MRRTQLVTTVAGALSAGALVLGGCAPAPAKAPAGGGTSAAVLTAGGSPAPAPAARGAVHFVGYSKNSDGPGLPRDRHRGGR